MILNPKETAVSYRCPECGESVVSIIGVFSLSGDMIKLKCPCGKSELVLTYSKDQKISLTVPCILCPSPHKFTISSNAFFERDFLELCCTYSGIGICWLGNKDKVFEALDRNYKELTELLGVENFDALSSMRGHNDNMLPDAQIADIVHFLLSDMSEEHSIHCDCKENGKYDFDFDDDSVVIYCTQCNKEKHFKLDSVQSAENFITMTSLTLDE